MKNKKDSQKTNSKIEYSLTVPTVDSLENQLSESFNSADEALKLLKLYKNKAASNDQDELYLKIVQSYNNAKAQLANFQNSVNQLLLNTKKVK